MGRVTREDLQRAAKGYSKSFLAENPDLAATLAPPARTSAPSCPDLAQKLPTAQKSPLNGKFAELWYAAGGPRLTPEYRFDPIRRWRFDYCLPDKMIAFELEGTVYQGNGGRHQTKKGMDGDCEKYFAAIVLHGWTVVRLTRALITPEAVAALLAWDRFKRSA
jgi:very-short-patch-repair endonuclease